MREPDYPWLHSASNKASSTAQQTYFHSLRVQLTVFSLVSLMGVTIGLFGVDGRRLVYALIAVLLVIGMVVAGVIREQRVDKRWFNARAIAESVKTATWRFMMQAPPFDVAEDAQSAFVRELDVIRKARPGLEQYMFPATADAPAITDQMRESRAASLVARKEAYIRDRLDDQIEWYSGKSRHNQLWARLWFWGVIGLQLLATVMAIVAAVRGPFALNWVSVLMTVAAAATGWSQAKRHDDLTISYAVAAQELIQIKNLMAPVTDELAFRELVDQGEEAVSREHTMWCARRSIPLNERKAR